MSKCVVIADDLTGGNATGVLLKKMEYKASTILDLHRVDKKTIMDNDCVIYPTGSRGLQPDDAYKRVYEACSLLKREEVIVYSKRIDSTLRGNLGAETDAMLDVLGENYVAIVSPAFPSSGRIYIGGYMLVNGVPLHKTDIAIDPKSPVSTSMGENLFKNQSKYKVDSIYTDDLTMGVEHLKNVIIEKANSGSRIIVIDCVSEEDIDLIADATISSNLKILAVDPGVFTATLSRKLIIPNDKKNRGNVLAIVGSANPNTKIQMENLWLSQNVNNVIVNTKALIESKKSREEEIKRVINEVLENNEKSMISTVTGDGIFPDNRLEFAFYMNEEYTTIEDITNVINRSLAEIGYGIFKKCSLFKGLYTSGGDVTVAVCEKFEMGGIALEEEVLPLAAYGKVLEGEFKGTHMITKGGSQGSSDAIIKCIMYLKEKLYI